MRVIRQDNNNIYSKRIAFKDLLQKLFGNSQIYNFSYYTCIRVSRELSLGNCCISIIFLLDIQSTTWEWRKRKFIMRILNINLVFPSSLYDLYAHLAFRTLQFSQTNASVVRWLNVTVLNKIVKSKDLFRQRTFVLRRIFIIYSTNRRLSKLPNMYGWMVWMALWREHDNATKTPHVYSNNCIWYLLSLK